MGIFDKVKKAIKKAGEQAKTNAENAKENVKDNYDRVEDQTKTNAKNAEENIKGNYDRIEDQTKTNAKHLGEKIEQAGENFFRWIREDDCDRVGRKEGEEAKRKCEAEKEGNGGGGDVRPAEHYAAKEVDCYERGESSRWGTSTIQYWSKDSVPHAEREVDRIIADYNGQVCATRWGYSELRDGDSRWVHK